MQAEVPQLPSWVPVPWTRSCSVWLKVFTGSPASRPAYLIAGFGVLLEVVYSMARSPARSSARLGTQRCRTFAPSGSQVVACGRLAATVPPVTFTWYQRGAAKPLVSCRRTVWAVHSDSTPPKFVYWFCIIARTWMGSGPWMLPPREGTLARFAFGHLVGAGGWSGPVKVAPGGRVGLA